MLGRRSFVRGTLLGIGAALFPAHWSLRLRLFERSAIGDEIVIVDGWVLLAEDLIAVLG